MHPPSLPFLASAVAVLLLASKASAQTWTPTAGGSFDWNNDSNWTASPFPNAIGATATLTVDLLGDQTVSLNQAITVGTLTINDSGASPDNSFTIAAGTGGSLILQRSSGSAVVTLGANSGTHLISVPVTLNSSASFAIDTSLTISGAISGAGGLSKGNNGTLALTGINDFAGNVSISGGTLSVSTLGDIGAASALGAGSAINMSNGGSNANVTLEYTGGTSVSTNKQVRLTGTGSANFNATIKSNGTGAIHFTDTGDVVSGTTTGGVKRLILGGTNTGANQFDGRINQNSAGTVALQKADDGTWKLANETSDYTGSTNLSGGLLEVTKLANGGVASSIGAASNAATTLLLGNGTTLRYSGTGDSTDRLFTVNGTSNGHSATLESAGTGAVNFTNAGNIAWGTTNQTRMLELGGTNTANNTLASIIANNGTGAVSFTKQDAGKWILTGDNTYTGATTVDGGTLLVNGSHNAASAVTVNTGGRIGGLGSVGAVDFATGAGLAYDVASAAQGGDGLTTTSFSGTGIGGFTLYLTGAASGFDDTQNYSWAVLTSNSTDIGSISLASITLDVTGFTPVETGTFNLSKDATSIFVNYVAAIPEPSSYASLLGGAAVLLAGVSRTRRLRRG